MSSITWMVYDPHTGWEQYDTERAAREALDGILEVLADRAADGWHEAAEEARLVRAETVARVRLRVTALRDDESDSGEKCRANGWDFLAVGEIVDIEARRQ